MNELVTQTYEASVVKFGLQCDVPLGINPENVRWKTTECEDVMRKQLEVFLTSINNQKESSRTIDLYPINIWHDLLNTFGNRMMELVMMVEVRHRNKTVCSWLKRRIQEQIIDRVKYKRVTVKETIVNNICPHVAAPKNCHRFLMYGYSYDCSNQERVLIEQIVNLASSYNQMSREFGFETKFMSRLLYLVEDLNLVRNA